MVGTGSAHHQLKWMNRVNIPPNLSSPNPSAQRSTLFMTCQVALVMSNGCMIKARALLACSSLTSFITEHLAQRLSAPVCANHWYRQRWVQIIFTLCGGFQRGKFQIFECWKDFQTRLESGGCGPAEDHHNVAYIASSVGLKLEALDGPLSDWPRIWHARIHKLIAWSRRIQSCSMSRLADGTA